MRLLHGKFLLPVTLVTPINHRLDKILTSSLMNKANLVVIYTDEQPALVP